ncbi:MAG: IS630 family transposase [Bryobacterales bacterium]|nr:IS630 family transposase [Bryobacterales bacterium]
MGRLTEEQRRTLIEMRDNHPLPYLRERAAGVLKADETAFHVVGLHGLLRTRTAKTVSSWYHDYLMRGIAGLYIAKGRGRKPACFPCSDEEARQKTIEVIHQDPAHFDLKQSRWTLTALRGACEWIACKSVPGVWRMLRRWRIHHKRARGHLHSPDPDYFAKLKRVLDIVAKAAAEPDRFVVLFEDEIGFYRQPSLSKAYETSGHEQPVAELGHRSNLVSRVAGCINIFTGQVIHRQRSCLGVEQLTAFYQEVAACYPDAETIYIIQDNWPVHFHPDLVAALLPQQLPFRIIRPSNWKAEPSKKAKRLNLPLCLVQLPTYAPWTNPIEKLWRKLRQDLLHLHRFGDTWLALKQAVSSYLDQFAEGCRELLLYVGLSDPAKLYQTAFNVCTPANN